MYPTSRTIFNIFITAFSIVWTAAFYSCQPDAKQEPEKSFSEPRIVSQSPITLPQSPEESLKTFRLPEGYKLELVATEPMITEPVAIAWDGNGRMYVAQMDTYMQTVDAKGQEEPLSKIMLLEDTDSDGMMDKSSVFVDSLTAPRMLLCVGHELFVNETNSYSIDAYKDTDNDGQADERRTVYENPKRAYGNIEHQRSGLDWNLDNWIYVTTDPVRFRYLNGQLIVDSLISGSNGQWGLTHDDYGRLFFSRAASGVAASGFQINPVYGQLELEGAFDEKFHEVWPRVITPDVNGGPRTLRPDSTMFSFTSVTGQSVYRGDRLPETARGNYFVADPVGRFVRRAFIKDNDGIITFKNAYEQDEFLTSTDMNFRPVNTYTGPDGYLYIVDMYRGIIQESTWAQPGSFLHHQIINKGLDQNIKRGRIYRLVFDGIDRGETPRLLDASGQELVQYLSHPNGWVRDNAQKELVVRGDHSVIPTLNKFLTSTSSEPFARLHALWTLDGLGAADKKIVLNALGDDDVQIVKAGIRLSEIFLKDSDDEVLNAVALLKTHPSRDVRAQIVLSFSQIEDPRAKATLETIFEKSTADKFLAGIRESLMKSEEDRTFGYKLAALKPEARRSVIEGARIFRSMCGSCHGPEGQGLPNNIAPPLISKFKLIERKDEVIKIMLHGLKGPVDGKSYTEQMVPMGDNSDEWIASVLSYVRYDLCMQSFPRMNEGYLNWVIITPEDVKRVREENRSRRSPWTWQELLAQQDTQ